VALAEELEVRGGSGSKKRPLKTAFLPANVVIVITTFPRTSRSSYVPPLKFDTV
jgi:hypothetical protein